ncbi:cell wall-associated NlpC family hydrolase [Microvirga flocculans]|uniref:Cell wall-associated NlpC family hydrolase n=1 Tax=Microvirga flocculans TaxID=217168 RepID=A0A7W6IG49_9HYPH|nr:NlpC/P60 family protein [Microvirga flocculans]MBB4040526.1 cell wall-associated NlpC family hydrolase [Microvirga flocculans]
MNFDRRITPVRADLADERLRGQVEAERYTPGAVKRVVASFSALHRQPSREAPVDTQAIFGESVTVYDEHEGWAWVQLHGDGYVGYLPSAALDEPGIEPTHKVRAVRTFVYPGPNLKLPYLSYLTLNAKVAVTERQGDYARLATGGWVFAPHLDDLDAFEDDYVGVAERFLHTPYLWGGKTSLGIDCSGLAQTALTAAGIKAPRDSDMQERDLGTPVEVTPGLSGLLRGDLVFWKGHVGLMMDESNFIHATGHSMTVMIEPLAVAEERIRRTSYGPISSIKRLG